MTWSARQYRLFEDERTRPVRDLLAALPPIEARTGVDLGCGPGNSTELLAAQFPNAALYGIDSSADMVAAARRRLPRLRFEVADIDGWSDRGPFDVILANAVLHWVQDHQRLLPALIGRLGMGGALAVQMPDNLAEPAHRLMRSVAAEPPWADRLTGVSRGRAALADANWYFRLLRAHCASVDIWRTTYHHHLPGGPAAIVEWFKGSGLLPYLDALDPPQRAPFLERYAAALAPAYPALPDGSVLLAFPRLFLVAIR